jgi:hypothetical protein
MVYADIYIYKLVPASTIIEFIVIFNSRKIDKFIIVLPSLIL